MRRCPFIALVALAACGRSGPNTDGGLPSPDASAPGRDAGVLYQDAGWSLVPSGTTANLLALWGASDDAIWAVGSGGTILFWNGATWTPQQSGVTADLTGVSGTSTTDVWAVGATSTMLHWNGWGWSSFPLGPDVPQPIAFTGVEAGGFPAGLAVGARWGVPVALIWDAGTWVPSDTTPFDDTPIVGLTPVASDAEAVTAVGVVAFWNFTAWTALATPIPQRPTGLSGGDAIWVTTVDGGLYTNGLWSTSQWTEQPTGTTAALEAAWDFPGEDLWAVGEGGTLVHVPGTLLQLSDSQPELVASPTQATLRALWGTASQTLWAAGDDGVLLHYQPPGTLCGTQYCDVMQACVLPCCPDGGATWCPSGPFCTTLNPACGGGALSCGCLSQFALNLCEPGACSTAGEGSISCTCD